MQSDKKIEKEQEWNNKLADLDTVVDRLGKGLDEHIKETVAAFNLNGFNTDGSCEGHVNWGLGAPWVEIEAPNKPKERYVGEVKILQNIAESYGISDKDIEWAMNETAWKEAYDLFEKNGETEEYKKWRSENDKLKQRAGELMDEFYKNRIVDEKVHLKFERVDAGETFRIYNGGEDYALSQKMDEEQKRGLGQRIIKYQEEMNAFGEFLKDKFLNS